MPTPRTTPVLTLALLAMSAAATGCSASADADTPGSGAAPAFSEHEVAHLLYLVDRVRVTAVAKGRPYNPNEDINMPDVDVTAPVYAIKGSLTSYQCSPLTTPGLRSVGFADNTGKNCNAGDQPDATGLCFRNTFGDWSCSLLDIAHVDKTQRDVAPPGA